LSHVNPSISTLPDDTEEGQDKVKETTLFGSVFFKKVTNRMEEQKALVKVAGVRNGPPHKSQHSRDPNDHHRFFEKGTPENYGGKNSKRQQLYPVKCT